MCSSLPAKPVFGLGDRTIHGSLLPALCRAPSLLPLPSPLATLDLARLSRPFSLIGHALALIGGLLSSVCFLFSLIRRCIAAIREEGLARGAPLAGDQLSLMHLQRDLAGLDIRLAIVNRGGLMGALITCRRLAPEPLFLTLDQLGPAAFQRRTFTLMRGQLPMQTGARDVALSLPEMRRTLMTGRGPFMAHSCVDVATGRPGHQPSMTAMTTQPLLR